MQLKLQFRKLLCPPLFSKLVDDFETVSLINSTNLENRRKCGSKQHYKYLLQVKFYLASKRAEKK
jgi:hypothetical protein